MFVNCGLGSDVYEAWLTMPHRFCYHSFGSDTERIGTGNWRVKVEKSKTRSSICTCRTDLRDEECYKAKELVIWTRLLV